MATPDGGQRTGGKLIIVHHHLRPGGVRRIIELATPHVLRAFRGRIDSVTLATGEAADPHWQESFAQRVSPVALEYYIAPALGYASDQTDASTGLPRRLRTAIAGLLAGSAPDNCLVWAHNLGLARNLPLTRELTRACVERGIRLLAHHHDWWFDNRWQRWPEIRRAGFRTLKATAGAIFSGQPTVAHVTINRADDRILNRHLNGHAAWLPNLVERTPPPAPARVRAARTWLHQRIGTDAPVWLMPARLLRRKNLAEALLLTRWLRPDAWLVTTGGASSDDERGYLKQFETAIFTHGWPVRLGVLQGNEANQPAVAELLAASETLLLTSIQEGFGLPYVEAAAARRPLIARLLPNIAPDLATFGFRFPQGYTELLVDPRLFDWRGEQARQHQLFLAWRGRLPAECRRLVELPWFLATTEPPHAVPFSRLTLTAQLEVLARPVEQSWACCEPLNPFLKVWRQRAGTRRLQRTPWPHPADQWLGGAAYGERFRAIATRQPRGTLSAEAGLAAQRDFMRERLGAQNLFPLLWAART